MKLNVYYSAEQNNRISFTAYEDYECVNSSRPWPSIVGIADATKLMKPSDGLNQRNVWTLVDAPVRGAYKVTYCYQHADGSVDLVVLDSDHLGDLIVAIRFDDQAAFDLDFDEPLWLLTGHP
jgi:hypothetical protein